MGKLKQFKNRSKNLIKTTLILSVGFAVPSFAEMFEGAHFSIDVPEGFRAAPSLTSRTIEDKFDSMLVHSPDGEVSFYVFAPEAGGFPDDILLKPQVESVVADHGEEADGYVFSWWTITAKDESYARSYFARSHLNGAETRIFGVKYPDGETLAQYRDVYEAFKASFEKFAKN